MTEGHHLGVFVARKRSLLACRQLDEPDGRHLYQYRITTEEFRDLERLLHEYLGSSSVLDLPQISRTAGFPGLFVLYAAEWWRRRFDGAHWSWEPILHDIGADPDAWSQSQRSECVQSGLKEWGLQIRETGGLRFLGTIAVQGGLPLRLLAQARGKIGQLLSQVLRQAGNSGVTYSDLLVWVESLQGGLPKSYRQTAVYTLLADVAWTILRLKEEVGLTSSVDAIARLDQQVNGWRERFPLPIEDAHAQGLIEQLVRDVASVRIERHVLCLPVERHLVPDEDGSWSLQSTVALPNSIQAGQLATLFGLTPGELPRAGELALCVGSERLITTVRRMAGSDGYRVERRPWSYSGEISAHEHVLHFSVPDGRVWSGIAPRGEALDDDLPWAFSVGEPAHRFLRQGGGSVAAPEALVALPAGWHIRCGEGAEALACGGLLWLDRPVIRIRGTVEVMDGTGLSCQIRTGQAASSEENYEWRGQRIWLDFENPTMAFTGLPDLYRVTQDGVARKVDGSLGWGVIGAPAATNIQLVGPLSVRYPATGEIKQRARLVALPATATLSMASRDATSGDVKFHNWGAVTARVLTEGVRHESRCLNDTLVLSLSVAPGKRAPQRIQIEIFWRQTTTPVRMAVPFPGKGTRAFAANGTELRSGALLTAEQLAGVRVVMFDGGDNVPMALEIFSSHVGRPRRHNLRKLPGALSVEVRLQDYVTDIQHLLSADDSLDARATIEFRVGDSDPCRINVARYAATLEKNGSNVEIDSAGLAMLTLENIGSFPVMAMRLDQPGDEAVRLTPRTSEGVPTGSWAFSAQEREPGCWLIYSGPDAPVSFRPILWPVTGEVRTDSPLARAIGIPDQRDRETELDKVIEHLAEDFLDPCWSEVEQLAGQVGHLPLAALDIWRRFARSPKGMAALVFRFGTLPTGFLDRFDRELPFAWEAVPFVAWTQAMECLRNQCLRFGEDAGTSIFRIHLDSRIKDLTVAHHALDFLLGVASSAFISEAEPQLRALRHVGSTAVMRLFEGDHSLHLRLRQTHAEDNWPTDFNPFLTQFRAQGEIAHFLCPDTGYPDGVVNMPLLIAAQAVIDLTHRWFNEPSAIRALREHRAFDPEWFDEAYNLTVARCLADGLLGE